MDRDRLFSVLEHQWHMKNGTPLRKAPGRASGEERRGASSHSQEAGLTEGTQHHGHQSSNLLTPHTSGTRHLAKGLSIFINLG